MDVATFLASKRITKVAEGATWKNIPRADGSNDCLGAGIACLFIIAIFIFYAIMNGFFNL